MKKGTDKLSRYESQLESVCRLSESISQTSDLEEVYRISIDSLSEVLSTDRASILLFNSEGVMTFRAWRNLSDSYRQQVSGHSPWSVDSVNPQAIFIPDVNKNEDLHELKSVILQEGIQALAFIPLIFSNRLLGKFMIYFNEEHEFTQTEKLLAEAIARHVAFAIGVRQIEDQLKISLKEKEILLREVYHRVKNNLQVVTSMLSLQSISMHNEELRSALENSINRVHAMAVVHEELNHSADTKKINFQNYATRLVGTLIRSYGPESQRIRFEVNCDDTMLDSTTAVPLGLILNEIISNSLKHAFTNGCNSPMIKVEMPDANKLIISDNGSGISPSAGSNGESLGLRIVKLLADQLHASINIKRPGTIYEITLTP